MPRSLRIEYPGAVYHVMNRGNYRHDVFGTDVSKQAFEETLFAACERAGWILHGHAILDNHFHLCLETPDANLSVGMQWLQSTFANRFNRIVRERGHVFQGRYKCLIVDRDEYLGPLLHYIHLNPVRAGIVDVPGLKDWRWSSLWYLFRKRKRPKCFASTTCLHYAGRLLDKPAGRRLYLDYLSWLSASSMAQKDQYFSQMCRGWALGCREFKKKLMSSEVATEIERTGFETREARELYWEGLLDRLLAYHDKSEQDLVCSPKSSEWKVMIAYYMKRHTAVTNSWLSEHLHMGVLHGVSRYVASFERSNKHKRRSYKRMIAGIKP